MRLPLRTLCDADLLRAHAAASASLDGFRQATLQHGSLIQSWVGRADVVALEHYPRGGVVDRQHGSQFFYHCHRADSADRADRTEHGHVHLFWHATRSGRRRRLAPTTGTEAEWSRSAPTHLIAIGLNARGLPVSLFSVNRWVTGGHWFDAPTTLCMLNRFQLRDVPGHTESCAWITTFVQLYAPTVASVLEARDRRLARQTNPARALDDRRIEVINSARIDWMKDLQRLDDEVAARGQLAR